MAMQMGSQEWARATQGRMSRGDRLTMLQAVVRRQLPQLLGVQISRAFARPDRLNVDAIPLPDSLLCREADAYCAEVSPTFLHHHCLRTYFWGALVAQHDAIRFDAEQLWLAAMLHDLGLTAEKNHVPGCSCFAVAGAERAEAFLQARDYEPVKTQQVYEAICRHMGVPVEPEDGIEAHLLQAGAGYDVVGLNWQKIDSSTRERVIAKYPRLGMKKEFAATFAADAALHPESRSAMAMKLGFGSFIAMAPFAE